MSKFNVKATKPAVKGYIVTDTRATGRTGEGAPGYARSDTKSELYALGVTNMVSENTFYEKGGARDARYEALIAKAAIEDTDWTTRFLGWLRNDGNMRTASLVGGLEAARAMVATKVPGSRGIVNSVLQRADEPGEAFAYWTSHYGRKIPQPVKRGVADAALRLYNEYSLLKYDTPSHGFRFADVLDLAHPAPTRAAAERIFAMPDEAGAKVEAEDMERWLSSQNWRRDQQINEWLIRTSELFKFALARRHNRDEAPGEHLSVIRNQAQLRRVVAEGNYGALLSTHNLRGAGMTWEDALSLAGSKVPKRQLWEALIPVMGYMALLRNLRNFDEAGVSDEVAETVAKRLTDPDQVARSRQFPFRFLAAYRNAPSLRWGHPLDKALGASVANIPEFTGRTLILVDRSGSMFGTMSGKTELTRADAAAVFGAALKLRNGDRATLVEFGSTCRELTAPRGGSLLKLVQSFGNLGGTYTVAAMRQFYAQHDRVIIITDEQASDGDPGTVIPANVPLHTVNLSGYQFSGTAGGPNRHVHSGLTDASFKLIQLLEAGRDANYPF
jgi:TROVE domain-containing protein/VWA domain-containing protein